MMQGKIIWISAAKQLPDEGEEVLVNRNEKISLAVFSRKRFRLKEGGQVSAKEKNLTWTPVMQHPDSGPA
jgi:hypothetical protein